MAGEAREKCAVAAIVAPNTKIPASVPAYESLFAMQHRGAEATGLASLDPDGNLHSHRGRGLVRDVYDEDIIRALTGSTAVGHNRYPTAGSKKEHNQPFVDGAIGFAFGHNGTLPVTDLLERDLEKNNINTAHCNDSEMVGLAIAQRIRGGHGLPRATELVYPLLQGAFSCVAMHDGLVVAFRDSKGIRPLAIGSFEGGRAVASETCGLDIIDAKYDREVMPGEMVIIAQDGTIESRQIVEGEPKLDAFEIVYFARHDSQLYGQDVDEVRRRFGEQLAGQHPPSPQLKNTKNILVVPIPDSSVPAAEGYADRLGLQHRSAVLKNRYSGRTFMVPSDEGDDDNQKSRLSQLRRKHNIPRNAIRGRDVIFVDDSIVRMNTMPRIVALARFLGARSVSVLIASPPVMFPDFYGIDTPQQSELAAANMTIEAMRKAIDSNYLGFLSLKRMIKATGLPADMFTLSCFNGEYPIDIGRARRKEIKRPVNMRPNGRVSYFSKHDFSNLPAVV
ncbi:amidophosphoribosyltransferase [Candidatus Saccharibacteria bacterium CG10_big_fil_rev_8_21_14_0_10_47_8]|nr:MAG: amidophosphoribosyltransferase [Candidatus Saccharibacteria bacterium CG10_big_fil_rev_8_21_14_0_10_47_8]